MQTLVLFDIDGTLLEMTGNNCHFQAYRDAFRKVFGVGTSITWGELQGYTEQMVIHEALDREGVGRDEIKKKMKQCMVAISSSFNRNLEKTEITPLPGIPGLLDELKRRGAMLGLVTGNLSEVAEGKLKKIGIYDYFSVGGFGEYHMNRAELVRIAVGKAKKKGFTGNDIFLVGDSIFDIKAGNEAGVKTIGVLTGHTPETKLKAAGSDYVLKDLSDTKMFLEITCQ
ncbi:MAG: HAD family hydrolase [Candidatus Aenigmatarchaeota archaeon]